MKKLDYQFDQNIRDKIAELSPKEDRILRRMISAQITLYTQMFLATAAVYYSILSVMHPFFLTGVDAVILTIQAMLTTVFCVTFYFLLKFKKIASHNSRWILWGLMIIGIGNAYAHIFITQEHIQLTIATIAPIVIGLLSFDRRGFYSLNILSGVLFIIADVTIEGPYGSHFAFTYVLAVCMSYIAYGPRITNQVNQHILIIRNRSIAASLKLRTEEAERMSAIKSHFLANVSHELRTPLTGVVGMIDLIDKDVKTRGEGAIDTVTQLIGHAKESSGLLMTLINDILDFSKMEAGKLSLNPEAVSLIEVSNSTINMMASAAEAKGLSVVFEQEGTATNFDVMADSVRLSQVLFNYLGNAIKFSDDGTVVLKLRAIDQEDAIQVRWSVTDTGPGISPDMQERLFDRFEQAENSVFRGSVKGTGLGLAIVREIATLMGGTIGVDSKVGHGATFWFDVTLPKAGASDTSATDYQVKLAAEKPLKILFAEDNPVNKMLISKLLSHIAADVHAVDHGAELVRVAVENPDIDLIITDVRMPVMDGKQATEIIRSKGISVPVIFVTANSQAEEIEEYRSSGMTGFISKPIQMQKFYKAIYQGVFE